MHDLTNIDRKLGEVSSPAAVPSVPRTAEFSDGQLVNNDQIIPQNPENVKTQNPDVADISASQHGVTIRSQEPAPTFETTDEYLDALAQDDNFQPRRTTTASTLDPITQDNLPPDFKIDPNEGVLDGGLRNIPPEEERRANLQFYEQNQPTSDWAQAKKEAQAVLYPLKFLSETDRASTDKW